jgi:hypothetical protein
VIRLWRGRVEVIEHLKLPSLSSGSRMQQGCNSYTGVISD